MPLFSNKLQIEVHSRTIEAFERLKERKATLATAESCTGGWVSQAITSVSGSSAVFECGFVTYSNDAKQRLLGVSADTLSTFGAVSAETAQAMAEGALTHSSATVSVSVTGIAGPDGGTPDKPVGTVWFGWAMRGQATLTGHQCFEGDREAIRAQAVVYVLDGLIKMLSNKKNE